MSTPARIGVFAAIAVAAIGAYFAFSGGSSKDGSTVSTSSGVKATTPAFRVVRAEVPVNASGPVGGIKLIRAFAGDRVVITVKSSGYSGEVHLHGFNIKHDITANGTAVFNLSPHDTSAPSALGVVEMELEDISAQIAKVEIRPS